MNRRAIKKEVLGIVMFAVGIKVLLDHGSDIRLLTGLALVLLGWVSLTRSEKEADIVARRILEMIGINHVDERLAHPREPEEE